MRIRPEPTQVKHLSGAPILGKAPGLTPTNIRLGWKGLQGIKTPAYYEHSDITAVKVSSQWALGQNFLEYDSGGSIRKDLFPG